MTYPKTGMGYRKPSMPQPTRRAARIRPMSTPSLFHEAALLISSGLCVWCESAPASEGSHLCRACRVDDPDGVLAPPNAVASPTG